MTRLDRRAFLSTSLAAAAGAALTPERLLAGVLPPRWAAAVADVDADIADAPMQRIHGRAPSDLAGTLFRNGPAKFRRPGGAATHWFDGDGLIRRYAIGDGGARMQARFVDTPKRRLEAKLGAMVVPGFGTPSRPGSQLANPDDANPANTSVLWTGGELLALWEGGSPVAVDPATLATAGPRTFRDDLRYLPFLAHPRLEPDGTVWNLGSGGRRVMIWKLAPGGRLASADVIPLPQASYFHDFTATARHLVIVLQPWLQEAGFKLPVATGLTWRPERPTMVMVVDKADLSKRRIYELPAMFAFHFGDAWEEADGTIRFDGCFASDPGFAVRGAEALLRGEDLDDPDPVLTQIVLRPDGRTSVVATGVVAEFPASDARRAGLARRVTHHVGGYRDGPFPHAVGSWDWSSGRARRFDFGDSQLVEEFLFVPKGDGERDGWLVGTTLNLAAGATELHVLAADRPEAGPLVTWRAAHALPLSFHGTFVAGSRG
ncbi:MAG: carotenoid oxygenase family protein [Alphaproteobacteria bacterium]|nr:carotenoid oxygenase family protein [Alphaproteobacteria bacterium]